MEAPALSFTISLHRYSILRLALFFYPLVVQVGLDSQTPCYEIDHTEVDMDEATLIGEVLSLYFNFFRQIFTVWTPYTHFRLPALGKRSSFKIFNPFYM